MASLKREDNKSGKIELLFQIRIQEVYSDISSCHICRYMTKKDQIEGDHNERVDT